MFSLIHVDEVLGSQATDSGDDDIAIVIERSDEPAYDI